VAKGWGFDTKAKRYRAGETGRFLAKKVVVQLRDDVVAAAAKDARNLAERAARGEITPEAFRDGVRVAVRNAQAAEYLFGRGGQNAMTPTDFGRLGGILRQAYARLEPLVMGVGSISEAQAANRAQMAVDGGVRAYEQGHASAWGVARMLPLYPGDNCLGMTNCRCSWDIKETDTTIDCTWKLGGSDPCGPCQSNAAYYDPYSITKGYAQPDAAPVRLRMPQLGLVG
jgi:hypothetical protein